ncbi:hypothetical protein TNCV_3807991 [Trichonephila clavipes]|nr:hypothetical protein TNCV_3807991 [Trichonephila clavipes]
MTMPVAKGPRVAEDSLLHERKRGCGSLVVKVSDWIVAGLVTSSSPVSLKTRCIGERCTLNLSRAQMFSGGVMW